MKAGKGTVYKHRYHFRQIFTQRDLRNVINYILQNHKKHKSMTSYSSLRPDVQLDEGRLFKTGSFLFHAYAKHLQSERSLLYE